MPLWLREKLFQKSLLASELKAIDPTVRLANKRLLFAEHHQSHAASAFFPSRSRGGRADDGRRRRMGNHRRSAIGEGTRLEILKEIHFPH